MKQPEDNMTAELDLDTKRGRGRPAKEDALTPAERAKRYRDNKRASGKTEPTIKRDASQEKNWKDEERNAAIAEIKRLKEQLAEATRAAKIGSTYNTAAYTEINGLKRQITLAENERNAAFKTNAELVEQLANAKTKIGKLSFDNEKMADKMIDMSKEMDKLTNELCKKRDASQKKMKTV